MPDLCQYQFPEGGMKGTRHQFIALYQTLGRMQPDADDGDICYFKNFQQFLDH